MRAGFRWVYFKTDENTPTQTNARAHTPELGVRTEREKDCTSSSKHAQPPKHPLLS